MLSTNNKNILITGKLQGLNIEIARIFSEKGDKCFVISETSDVTTGFVLHKIKENQIYTEVLEIDSVNFESLSSIFVWMKENGCKISVFIANSFNREIINSLDDFNEDAFLQHIEKSAWPIAGITKQLNSTFGEYPKYVIGFNNTTTEDKHAYEDAAMALNEVMVKYLNFHFFSKNVLFNILSLSIGPSASSEELQEIAKTIYMFSTGFMDAVRGQTIALKVKETNSDCGLMVNA